VVVRAPLAFWSLDLETNRQEYNSGAASWKAHTRRLKPEELIRTAKPSRSCMTQMNKVQKLVQDLVHFALVCLQRSVFYYSLDLLYCTVCYHFVLPNVFSFDSYIFRKVKGGPCNSVLLDLCRSRKSEWESGPRSVASDQFACRQIPSFGP
jgi:hypothetical protein